jgi:hypothetical protein
MTMGLVIDRLCDAVIVMAIVALIGVLVYYLGPMVLPVIMLCFLLAAGDH